MNQNFLIWIWDLFTKKLLIKFFTIRKMLTFRSKPNILQFFPTCWQTKEVLRNCCMHDTNSLVLHILSAIFSSVFSDHGWSAVDLLMMMMKMLLELWNLHYKTCPLRLETLETRQTLDIMPKCCEESSASLICTSKSVYRKNRQFYLNHSPTAETFN